MKTVICSTLLFSIYHLYGIIRHVLMSDHEYILRFMLHVSYLLFLHNISLVVFIYRLFLLAFRKCLHFVYCDRFCLEYMCKFETSAVSIQFTETNYKPTDLLLNMYVLNVNCVKKYNSIKLCKKLKYQGHMLLCIRM